METQLASLGIGPLFWAIGEAIVVVELASGQVALVNPAAERLLGYGRDQARGLPLEALMPKRLRVEVRRWRRRRLEMEIGEGDYKRLLVTLDFPGELFTREFLDERL